MNFLDENSTYLARLVVLSVLSISLMMIDQRGSYLESVRSGLSVLAFPIQQVASLPVNSSNWLVKNIKSNRNLQQENDRLTRENLFLNSQLLKFTSLQSENMRLRSLLQSSRKLSDDLLIAETIKVDLAPYERTIVINKGKDSNVFSGQAIIDAYGVMGQVNKPGLLRSTAILITDPAHAIPVKVARNGLRAVAYGTGKTDTLDIPYMPNNVDINIGDQLYSSGLGGVFPEGYPVATIKTIERHAGQAFAKIEATPLAHLERSQEVLLIQPNSSNLDVNAAEDEGDLTGSAEEVEGQQ
ncbi:MAG: rod shape-determining protein MreC [Gammaproteobacteria bacterium]|nr:rod shape-determining protein MreC [Gammaproteobacteria bacterium]